MRTLLLALMAMLIAAPLLTACGDPIKPEDRPIQDRTCPPGYQTSC